VIATLLAGLAAAIWAYLLVAHGGFWMGRERDDREALPAPEAWPRVVAVVPARDEADVIAGSVGSLLAQDYPGEFRVILVDDDSSDGTAEVARKEAERLGAMERLQVVRGRPLQAGWTGKLWAVSQGVALAGEAADFLWLTDADIAHSPDNLTALVSRAAAGRLALTSLMAELHCATFAERLLIPAFVFFFQMLYPFARVNDPDNRLGAAAGGCMLIRRDALAAAGGIAAIRGALIDDCALGAALKGQGAIWLGLTHRARSLRPYPTVASIAAMVSRSAYAQLNYSLLLLAGTVLGLAVTYLAAPLVAIFGHGLAQIAGLVAWAAMALAFQPILRFYRRSPLWGIALPAIAALYAAFTLDSALQFARGRGGMWKGRAQARAA